VVELQITAKTLRRQGRQKTKTNLLLCAWYFAAAASAARLPAQISSANKVQSTKFKAPFLMAFFGVLAVSFCDSYLCYPRKSDA